MAKIRVELSEEDKGLAGSALSDYLNLVWEYVPGVGPSERGKVVNEFEHRFREFGTTFELSEEEAEILREALRYLDERLGEGRLGRKADVARILAELG